MATWITAMHWRAPQKTHANWPRLVRAAAQPAVQRWVQASKSPAPVYQLRLPGR
jgi:hypothetical protein